MLGATHHIIKIKTMLIAITLMLIVVKYSDAQEAHEHIHAADAVMNQAFESNVELGTANLVIETIDAKFEFSLERNVKLLSGSYKLDDNVDVFKGTLTGVDKSWARFTQINGNIEGAYFDGEDLFLVKSYREIAPLLDSNALNYQESLLADTNAGTSLIINVEDIESTGTCALHDDMSNVSQFNDQSSFDYDTYVDELSDMLDAEAGMEIPISLYADVEFVDSSDDATADMLSLLNVVDGIFSEQIGVQLLLTDATELSDNGPLTSKDPVSLIVAFRNEGLPNPGVSHLFTNKNLQGSTVGIAYVGSLCRESSVGLTQKFGSKTSLIFAHELGHNFGAPHDNQSGSACSATPSGFVMNPNINGGSSTFSSCSIATMQPVIANALGNCIVEVAMRAPTITSVANVEAQIGIEYYYDNDRSVDANGTGPFSYSLDIAPAGMSINDYGELSWVPTSDNIGINTVQIRVSNVVGSDVQVFEVFIESAKAEPFINFSKVVSSSFDDQDATKSFEVGSSPYEVEIKGNSWRSIPFNYTVTPNTVIQFDFRSDVEGEIHGIAFENDNKISPESSFKIFGTQEWGITTGAYTDLGSTQSITIPVGDYIEGNFDKLVFIMDEDEYEDKANSVYANVIVFEDNEEPEPEPEPEPTPTIPVINIDELEISSHMPGYQDFDDIVEIIEGGKGIRVEGNSWKKVIPESVKVTPSTVLKFEFKSDSISEIHGLGIYTGEVIDKTRTIQIAGTQDWGIRDYNYTTVGEWQSFEIPIGEYLTTDQVELVFINDNDLNLDSDSNFRNVQFITNN